MQEHLKKLPRVAFWLVPQKRERDKLATMIAALAKEFSAPLFVPHVTLYSCFCSPDQQELALLAKIAACCEPMTLLTKGLFGRGCLSQALYFDVEKSDSVFRLSRQLADGVPSPSTYDFDPHVSLLYQNLSARERERLQARLEIELAEICFDQLWAVAIPGTMKVLEDFSGWRTLMMCRLDSDRKAATL